MWGATCVATLGNAIVRICTTWFDPTNQTIAYSEYGKCSWPVRIQTQAKSGKGWGESWFNTLIILYFRHRFSLCTSTKATVENKWLSEATPCNLSFSLLAESFILSIKSSGESAVLLIQDLTIRTEEVPLMKVFEFPWTVRSTVR